MNIMRKRIFIALIIILLACTACSPAATRPGPSPFEVPEFVTEPPPAAMLQQSGNPTADTDNGANSLLESPQPDEAVGQQERPSQPAAAGQQVSASPTEDVTTTAPKDDGPVVLTIGGDGVNGETTWTLNRLQELRDGYREITYSTTNNWPSFEHMQAHGVSIPYLLRQAGLKESAACFKFVSTDGYFAVMTYDQIFGTRYSYSSHSASGSSGASAVEPVIAWVWGNDQKVRPENIRPFFGQSGPWDVNTSSFVKNLCKIEVLTSSAGSWAAPGASIADGSMVPVGTLLELSHSAMDNVRIYYTLDGSEPDYLSPVYNPSTSYFQPQLNKPLVLTKSVTIKMFASGLGKERSPVVTFVISVE